MLEVKNLGRDYVTGGSRLTALHEINLTIQDQEFVAITGQSGSGKSTLLGLLAGLDRPTRGQIFVDGVELTALDEDGLSDLRGRTMGFVFQSFQLIQTLTALENVRVPAEIQGDFEAADRAGALLASVGLGDRVSHYPNQLSGGEMQRVALARASITRPRILFADEPTGNLDSRNGEMVMRLLLEMNRSCTLVLVTHNPALAAMAHREIRLRDGAVEQIVVNKKKTGRDGRTTADRLASNGRKKSAGTSKKQKAKPTR